MTKWGYFSPRKNSADVRDARREGLEVARKRGRAAKDRRRWCGGHEGREHRLVCRSWREVKRNGRESWRILMCEVCGREQDAWCPFPRLRKVGGLWVEIPNDEPPPSWVTS
jgi:hypothetical protein